MSKFKKGESGNPNGRKKGIPNRSTTQFREAITRLLEQSSPKFQEWLEEIAMESPRDAIDVICKLAEFAHPKLARTEHTGLDGDPIETKNTLVIKVGDGTTVTQ